MVGSVSVVIPAYNAARFITDALDSITCQTIRADKIAVVDDGSLDNTVEIALAWAESANIPTTVTRATHRGAGAARRFGLGETSGEFVLFLDADDRLAPSALERLRSALLQSPEAFVAYGEQLPFADGPTGEEHREARRVIGVGAAMLPSSSLVRRAAFDIVGDFLDDNFSAFDWFARIVELGDTYSVSVDAIVVERRIHQSNTSSMESHRNELYARALKQSLDRRRREARSHK